jgi:hypothetical protein
MFFDNYPLHQDARIRPSLLWEYDLDGFDWGAMRNIVLQRVIERGRITDFYAALNLYGLSGFIEGVRHIPYMNTKDRTFVCTVFGIKKEDLSCYTQKPLRQQHWHS